MTKEIEMNRAGRLRNAFIATAAVVAIGFGVIGAGRAVGAQDATPTASAASGTVTVNGTGSVTVTPDAASISIGVNVMNANLSEAQAAATSQMNAVIDALKAAGIDEKDIQTNNYSVNVMQNYDNNGYPTDITGYQINNQVNVTVRDLDKLGDILQQAVDAGANSIYGITFFVTDSSEAASQARTAAVTDAKTRAEELAAATGATLGKVVSISETSGPSPIPVDFFGGAGMAADSMKSAVPVQSGGSVIQVSVTVTYELIE
jgi:uncharacterized protein YggE